MTADAAPAESPPPASFGLADLGLSFERHIAPALRAGEAEWRRYGPLDPPNLPGAARWGRIVRALRELLAPAGWTWDNPRNLPRVIAPDAAFALVVYTGDALTGLTGLPLPAQPSTKHHKGPTAASAVARNAVQRQLALEFPGLDAPRGVPVDLVTWILLVHRGDREIRSEVSLPASIDTGGHIDRWVHRIPLPGVPVPAAARPDAGPAARPEARPEARPDARPEARPDAHPVVRPAG